MSPRNPPLRLDDGRLANDIKDEAEILKIIAELEHEIGQIEVQVDTAKEKLALGVQGVKTRWLFGARKALAHRRTTVSGLQALLKARRREEHQKRDAVRLIKAKETPAEKEARIRLANQQHETELALFKEVVRNRLPNEQYLALWAEVREQMAHG